MDQYTLVQHDFNGVDEAVYVSDPYTFAPPILSGGAKLDSAQVKWNATSLYLASNTSKCFFDRGYATFGTSNFTIEFWVYSVSTASLYPNIVGNGITSWGAGACAIQADHTWSANKYVVNVYDFNTTTYMLTSTTSVDYAGWQHVAWVRVGNTHMLYINGTAEDSETFSGNVNFSTGIVIGYKGYDHVALGWYTGFRISSIARYTSNFTPRPYPFLATGPAVPKWRGDRRWAW